MYIYGKNVVKETINSNKKIIKAYVNKKIKNNEIIDLMKKKNIKIHFVEENILNHLVDGNHQGFVIEVDEITTYPLEELFNMEEGEHPIVVVLDHLEDPHNFGAIIRTCEAMGVKGIVIPNDRNVGITGTVVKTSAGAIQHTKIIRTPNLATAIDKLKKHGYWVVGTDMDGTDYITLDYNMPIVLVIGNEGSGISNIVKKSCDYIAKIPMYGKINSLNASVSCGMFLSEIINARRKI